MSDFTGKCVVVTGGASGFGKAMSLKFASAGASVVVADINGAGAEAVAAGLPDAMAFQMDVSSEEDNQALVAATVEAYGKIDVFCANAGIPHRAKMMMKQDVEEFDSMWAINVRSIFLAAKYCCLLYTSPSPRD